MVYNNLSSTVNYFATAFFSLQSKQPFIFQSLWMLHEGENKQGKNDQKCSFYVNIYVSTVISHLFHMNFIWVNYNTCHFALSFDEM